MIPGTDREAITLIIDGLIERGCKPTMVRDEEDEYPVSTTAEAVEHVTDVDEAVLFVDLPPGAGRESTHVYFVLGNEPREVASDYGVSLSPYIDPITDPWWNQ